MIGSHPETIQETAKGHHIKTKDTYIIQEISRDLGALGQEPVSKPNIYFLP